MVDILSMLSTLTLHVIGLLLFKRAFSMCCRGNSEWLPVLSGIPQGTVLGPVLFILFIDDIGVFCSGSVTHKLFAGDMKLYSTIDTNLDGCSLQSALDRLHMVLQLATIRKCWQVPCIAYW